ncbi:MAG TPA: aminotransferase class I/II-fold pyridoxal phosphate-dependent enzyme, partial [Planctomycetaceae bacterium]|nr:aminotransferase class I/II-fold pyridoxal phosphate-dependent enzyme [Planctomycetaceae bacterium]
MLDWIDAELVELAANGLLRQRRSVRPQPGGMCEIEGRRLWNFAANDYLDLAFDPRVLAAAQQALIDSGAGATASALVSGRTPWHVALEQQLAQYVRAEAALLFPTGYAANVGAISALAGEADAIFCDRANHASLLDGCRLSGAQFRVYRHDDLPGLIRALGRISARRRWIVTDTLFSMEGDLAPLAELCEIADRFEAGLILDEAHALGAIGSTGRGGAELARVESRVPVRIATLSKA